MSNPGILVLIGSGGGSSGTAGYLGPFANPAAFPGTAKNGDIALSLSDDSFYFFDSGSSTWMGTHPASGTISHSSLTNLLSDDHTQYLLANGTRALSANWAAGAFSATHNSVIVGSAANTISGLSNIVNTGTLTLPTATDTLVGRATTDTLTNKSLDAGSNTITNLANANIAAAAAIAYSKLNLTGSILNADINASAAIAYSKLSLSNSILNADINAAAAIAYSKLDLSGSIVNADIAAAAAIARSKVAAGTVNYVVYNDGATGLLNQEQFLAKSRGGTNQDNSSVTFPASGVLVTEAGTETLTNKTLAVASNSITSSNYQTAVFGATGNLSSITTGTSGQFLKSAGAATLPAYASIVQADVGGLTTASSPTFTALTLTSGINGVTSGSDYAAGYVFENQQQDQSSFTSTNVASTGVWGYATSKSLNAGIWLVFGTVGFSSNGAALTDFLQAAISTSSTGVGIVDNDSMKSSSLLDGNPLFGPVPVKRLVLSAPTTVYLNTFFNYTSGSPQHQGRLEAVRLG